MAPYQGLEIHAKNNHPAKQIALHQKKKKKDHFVLPDLKGAPNEKRREMKI